MAEVTRLHLGCGPHIFPGWINLDIDPGIGGMRHDLREHLPFDEGSVDYIFTEHTIEHLTAADGLFLLRQCFLVLKPGGILRISTPNLKSLVDDYMQSRIDRFYPTWEPQTPCRMLNEGMRLWGHQFLYDLRELVEVLQFTRFKEIYERRWRVSSHTALNGLEIRPYHNDLIVEATR